MSARSIGPAADELEVSVFGPGRGECIVVHVPDGPWFVVDSLVVRDAQGAHEPVASAYLRLLGVTDLWGLFLTHWHDDHTCGAGSLIRQFSSSLAVVGVPDGFGKRELTSLVADRLPDELRSKEVKDIVDVVGALKAASHVQALPLAVQVRLNPHGTSWSLECLSPSAADLRHHAETLLKFLPSYEGPPPPAWDTNSGCAVLRLEAAGRVVMLCSDLDVGAPPDRGWGAIVHHHKAVLPSDIVKIGHHGSQTALSEDAWKEFGVEATPKGVVTPFPAKGGRLPREEQAARFRKLCHEVHVTAPAKSASKAGKVPTKDTPFASYVVSSPRTLEGTGQVRYRARSGQPIRVEVFPPANNL